MIELVNDEVLTHYINSLLELIKICLNDPKKQSGLEILGA